MRFIEWVIKPSTYCNLRCRYCYEWNGLGDKARMPISIWRKIADGIAQYHHLSAGQSGEEIATRIIWHGGEPFALPTEYFRSLLHEQQAAARRFGIGRDQITTCVQTNLTLLSQATLDLIKEYDLRIGVSMDIVPGVRLSLTGCKTESRVMRNMDRLRTHNIRFGAITVLAKHTCLEICRVYDFWAAQAVSLRILPLFAGPAERDVESFNATEEDLVAALCRLFDHWLSSSAQIEVAPLDEWLQTVVRHKLGEEAETYDRRREGESVWVVRPNGDLFQTNEVGIDAHSLGNLAESSLTEILAGARYSASLDRSEAITARVCTRCAYQRACDSYPAHAEAIDLTVPRRCPVAFHVYRYIETRLAQMGVNAMKLSAMAKA